MKTSPTQRSLKRLRDAGWTVCVVEKWIAQIKQRKDAFGFGDLLAVRVGTPGALLVQSTGGSSNFAPRLAKIRSIPEAGIWLAAGNRILLQCWRKVGAKGKRKLWDCREMEITTETLGSPWGDSERT